MTFGDSGSSPHPLSDLGFDLASNRFPKPALEDLGFVRAAADAAPDRAARAGKRHPRPPKFAAIGSRAAKAARRAAQTTGLKSEIALAINQPQLVGARDPESGRLITQPSDNPAVNQALATDEMPEYRAGLRSAIRSIRGAELAATRSVKNPSRLAEKIGEEHQPPETVSDYGAAQIAVDSPQTRDAVIAAVKKKFPIVREQNRFTHGDPQYGYRSYSMQVEMPNGASEELQIVPKEVFEANREEHHEYKAARDAKLAGVNARALQAEARALNDAAMARFNARNGIGGNASNALVKGSAVMLPDGSQGKISYLDRNMKIARVRTGDGRNLTVRQRELRVIHHDR